MCQMFGVPLEDTKFLSAQMARTDVRCVFGEKFFLLTCCIRTVVMPVTRKECHVATANTRGISGIVAGVLSVVMCGLFFKSAGCNEDVNGTKRFETVTAPRPSLSVVAGPTEVAV